MGTGDQNCLHRDAAAYYYEMVAQRGAEVPDSVARHVRGCLVCRARVKRLRKIVAEIASEADLQRGPMDRDVIEILNLHFRSLGEPVTCSRVKPFLPGLLDPSHQIRIPTPITVHVDHCPSCAADLAVLRGLALQPGQLERLGRLYAAPAQGSSSLCRRARLKIPAFAAASLDGIDRGLLNHLCTCRDCRAEVYRYRQKLLEGKSSEKATADAGCRDALSIADLFDFVIAYDLPASDAGKAGGSDRPAGAHVRTCPPCLGAIQTLHQAAYGIAERPDSDVVTTYRTTQDAREAPANDDLYPNYPIDVQVAHRLPEQAATRPRWPAAAAAAFGRTASRLRAKPLLKAAIVVAAVIPLAFLFLNTHTAAGLTLADVVKAFEKADNIHISRFFSETDELIQELWISRGRNILVTTGNQERTLYNLNKREKRTVSQASESVELAEQEYRFSRQIIDRCLGLPAADISRNARWKRVEGEASGGSDLYELTVEERDGQGSPLFKRYWVVVDPHTKLPKEMRMFRRGFAENEWEYSSRREFEYLTEDEMTPVIGNQAP